MTMGMNLWWREKKKAQQGLSSFPLSEAKDTAGLPAGGSLLFTSPLPDLQQSSVLQLIKQSEVAAFVPTCG